jgi:hypothetical protein
MTVLIPLLLDVRASTCPEFGEGPSFVRWLNIKVNDYSQWLGRARGSVVG